MDQGEAAVMALLTIKGMGQKNASKEQLKKRKKEKNKLGKGCFALFRIIILLLFVVFCTKT